MFTALHTAADFGHADYLVLASWWTLGNMVGGMLLVTLVRLVQGVVARSSRPGGNRFDGCAPPTLTSSWRSEAGPRGAWHDALVDRNRGVRV
jgi:hypothetical protein